MRAPGIAIACMALCCGALAWPAGAAAPKPKKIDPKTQKNIDAILKVLPAAEKAVGEVERALQPLLGSKDPNVIAAADAAALRVSAVRSVRKIIAEAPLFLRWHLGAGRVTAQAEGAKYYLECARAGRDPFAGAVKGVRAFRSPLDGQLLFYVFRLPAGFDPKQTYPLEVGLHSGAGLVWHADWVDGKPSVRRRDAHKARAVYISPCGRGNNCYAAMGEVAVMDAIADARKHYPIDGDRVILGGASMGGTGGFRLGVNHPDAFSAVYSLTGGANYSVPVGNGRFDGYMLPDNLANTALMIWDTPGDGHYKANHAFADALRALAGKYAGGYPLLELTDPKGGHGIIDRKLQAQGWEWMRKQVRKPWPGRVIFKTYSLRYDGAFWARIDTFADPASPARIDARLEAGKVAVEVANAGRFSLNLARPLVGEARQVEVAVNGAPAGKAPAGGWVHFASADGKWGPSAERYPKGLVKKHGLSGPVVDVFMARPVLIVFGGEAAEGGKTADRIVRRLWGRGDGGKVLHTAFDRKADKDVTAADIAERNLVLLGRPESNALLARIAGKLPARYIDGGVAVGGKEYRGKDVGLILVYPNPLNPERYVLILPADYVGGEPLSFPDWLVVRAVTGGRRDYQRTLASGTFDGSWK